MTGYDESAVADSASVQGPGAVEDAEGGIGEIGVVQSGIYALCGGHAQDDMADGSARGVVGSVAWSVVKEVDVVGAGREEAAQKVGDIGVSRRAGSLAQNLESLLLHSWG